MGPGPYFPVGTEIPVIWTIPRFQRPDRSKSARRHGRACGVRVGLLVRPPGRTRGRKGKEEKRREKEKGERGGRERERERKKERKRGRSRGSYDAAAVDVEIDPQSCRFRRSQTHCALQAIVERRAAVAKRIAVLLRWHSDGGEVRRGLSTGLGGPVRKSGPRIDTIQSCAFRGP